jgi:hypothetical protein
MHTTKVQSARLRSARLRFDRRRRAPSNAENPIAVHLVVVVPSCATGKTVALAR